MAHRPLTLPRDWEEPLVLPPLLRHWLRDTALHDQQDVALLQLA